MADYTLQQARADIAEIRGVIARLNLIYGSGGQLNYLGKDGNTYNTGRMSSSVPTGNYTVTGVLTNITGLALPVSAGKYRVNADVIISNGGIAQAINLGSTGPAISDMRLQWRVFINAMSSQSVIGTTSQNVLGYFATPSLNQNQAYTCLIDGWINFSADGTFGIETSAANACTIVGDSYLDIMPVSLP